MELITQNQEILNTKDKINIDLIKDGREFLEQFKEINHDLLMDTVSIIYRYLRTSGKIPYNLYKFFIAAYYIVSRHPLAFPDHTSKKDFCQGFGIEPSSLDYSVDKIVKTLNIVRILDDKNFPYFFNPKSDLGIKLTRNIVKSKVEKVVMNFLLYNQPVNAQILSEELVTKIIFEMKLFPEELFRQFYEIIFNFVESDLQDYYGYVQLQQKYFI